MQANLRTRSRLGTSLRLAPYVPLACAIALLLGSQLTWVTLRFAFFTDSASSATNTFDIPITGGSGLLGLLAQTPLVAFARVTSFLWDVFSLTGILLCLTLLWQRRIARALLVLYGGWLLLTTSICLLILTYALTMTNPFPCGPGDPLCPQLWVVSRGVGPGGWLALGSLALGSLALGWLAFGALMYRQRSLAVGASLASAPALGARVVGYSPFRRLNAGIFTLGAALWAVGLYAVPWATSGCTGLHFSLNHFVGATCSGVDGYDVLTAGLGVRGALAWPLLEVASVIGLFIAVAIWLPRLPRATWMIALGWSLLATVMALVGMRGIAVTMAHPPHFTYEEGPWEPSYGIVICAIGIVVGVIGVALLARDELRRAR